MAERFPLNFGYEEGEQPETISRSLIKIESNFDVVYSLLQNVKLTANKTVITYLNQEGTTENDTVLLTVTPKGFEGSILRYKFVSGNNETGYIEPDDTAGGDLVWEMPDSWEPANEESIVVTVNAYEVVDGTVQDIVIASDSVTITGIQGLFEGVIGPAGRDAINVKLLANRYAVRYNEAGTETDEIFFTTQIQGVTNPQYRFYVNDVLKQEGTDSEFYLADSSEPEIEGVITVKVELYLNEDDTAGEVLASDSVSIYAVQDGSDALTVILTNDSHTLPVGPDDVVNYTGSGTDVIVYQGKDTLTATTKNNSSELEDGEFFVNTSVIQSEATTIQIGTASVETDADGNSVLRFADHSNLSDSFVQIKYSVVIRNFDGIIKTIPRIQTLTRADAGLNAKVAKLLANQYVIRYTESGTEGDAIELEVQYQGFDGTPFIHFYVNGNLIELTEDENGKFLLPDEYEPSIGGVTNIRVELSDDDTTGNPTAFDSISIYGIQDGSDAITAFLTNPTHVVPTDEFGVIDADFVSDGVIQGAGGTFKVFVGATDVTTQCAFDIAANDLNDEISTIDQSTGVYSILSELYDTAGESPDYNIEIYQVTIPANVAKTNEDVVIQATYSIAKSRAGISPSFVDLTNESVTLAAEEDGTLKGISPYTSTTVQIFDRGELQDGFTTNSQTTTNNIWTITANANGCTGSFTSGTTYEITDVDDDNATVTFTSVKTGSDDYVRVFTINKARDAARSLTGYLTNEIHAIPADSEGNFELSDLDNAGGEFIVFLGNSDVTNECDFEVVGETGWIEFTSASSNEYIITDVPFNRNTAVLKATYTYPDTSTVSIQKYYTINKTKGGVNAKIIRIDASTQAFVEDKDGIVSPDVITFTIDTQNIDMDVYDVEWETYQYVNGTLTKDDPDLLDTQSDGAATLTEQTFGSSNFVSVVAKVTDTTGQVYFDRVSVYRVKDGIPATIYQIVPSVNLVRKAENGTLTPNGIEFTVNKIVGDSVETTSEVVIEIQSDQGSGFVRRGEEVPPYTYSIQPNDTSVRAILSIDTDGTVLDTETIPIVADGPTGASGNNAKVVKLTSSNYAIEYGANDTVGSVSNVTLTATDQNFIDPVYTFTCENDETIDLQVSSEGDRTATFNVPNEYFFEPLEFRVGVAESTDPSIEIAFDTINVYAVKPGADGDDGLDGYTVIMTNESHVFPANSASEVQSYSGSGTSIFVYKGATQLEGLVDTTGVGEGFFTVTATPSNTNDIVVGDDTDDPLSGAIVFADHNSMKDSVDVAWIDYDIEVEGLTTFTKRQSFSKSKAGLSAKVVKLIANQYVVKYLENGTEGDSIQLTASQQGFADPHYKFFVDDETRQFTDSPFFDLADSSEPEIQGVVNIKVEVYEGESGTEVLASDTVSIYAIQDGSDAIIGFLTNASHTVPASSSGSIEAGALNNAGGTFKVFVGGTEVTTSCSFSDNGSNIADIGGDGVYTILPENFGVGTNSATVTFTATIPADVAKTQDDVTIDAIYSISKSKEGISPSFVDLTNESVTLAAEEDGLLKGDGSAGDPYTETTVQIFDEGSLLLENEFTVNSGNDQITTNGTWEITANAVGCTGLFTSGTTYGITAVDDDNATVTFTSEKGNEDFIRVFTINKARDAARSLSGYLTNESHAIPAEFDGETTSGDYEDAGGQFIVFLGNSDVTNECDFEVFSLNPDTDPDWISFNTSPKNEYEITDVPNNRNTAVLRATYQNFDGEDLTIDRTYSLVKSLGGATGADAKILKIEASGQAFIENKDGQLTGDDISFTVDAQNIDLDATGVDITWTAFRIGGSNPGSFTLDSYSDGGAILTRDEEFSDADSVKVVASVTENQITYTDSITVYRIKDGIPATIYEIIPTVNSIRKSESGVLTPTTINFSVNKIVGDEVTPDSENDGTLKVYSFKSGANDFTLIDPTGLPYTIESDDISIKATFEIGGNILDQETIPIVVDGQNGTNAKVVKLTANQYVVRYLENGTEGDSIQLTAVSQGIDTPHYKFIVDGEERQFGTNSIFDLADSSEPEIEGVLNIEVEVYENGTGNSLASDTVSIYAIQNGSDAIIGFLTNASHTVPASSTGVIDPSVLNGTDITDAGGTFKVFVGGIEVTTDCNFSDNGSNVAEIDGSGVYTISSENFGVGIFSKIVTFTATVPAAIANTQENVTLDAIYSISKSKAGIDSVITNLTNDNHSVPADNDGNVLSGGLSGASTTFTIFQGGSNVTSDWSVSISVDGLTINESTGSQSSASSHSVSVADFDENSDSGTVTFNATNSNYSPVSAVFTVTKVRGGADGSPAVIYRVVPSASVIGANNENTIHTPSTITFTAYKTEGQTTTKLTSGGQLALYRNGSQTPITSPPESAPQSDGDLSYEITDNTTSLTIKLSINTVVVDEETIPVVLDGDQGAAGTDAKVVKLTSSRYAIEYDVDGDVVDNTAITLTATSQNFSNGFFKFTGGGSNFSDEASYTDGSGQNSDTASFTPPSSYFSTPLEFRVGVADGDQEEDAFDTISIYAVKPAADGVDAYTIIMQNESHTFAASTDGVVSNYSGGGNEFRVFKGATELQGISSGIPTTGQFSVSASIDENINVGSGPTVLQGYKPVNFGDPSNFLDNEDNAFIVFTIKLEGNTNTVSKTQSFSKSKQGVSGNSIKLAYKRNSTQPSSPSGGTLSTPPTGWYYTISAANSAGNLSDILWQSSGTFDSNGDNISWEEVQQFIGLDGAAGKNSWAIFIESATTPAAPSGGDEDTAPSGWSFTPPSDPTNPLWVSYGKYNDSDVVVYTTPSKYYSKLTVSDLLAGTLSVVMDIGAGGNIVNDTTESSGNYSTSTEAGYYLGDNADFFLGASNSDTSDDSGTFLFFDSSASELKLVGDENKIIIGTPNGTTDSKITIDKTGFKLDTDLTSGQEKNALLFGQGGAPFFRLVDNENDSRLTLSTVAVRLQNTVDGESAFDYDYVILRASNLNSAGGSNIENAFSGSGTDPSLFTGLFLKGDKTRNNTFYSENYNFFHTNGFYFGTKLDISPYTQYHYVKLEADDGDAPYLEFKHDNDSTRTLKIGTDGTNGGYIEADGDTPYLEFIHDNDSTRTLKIGTDGTNGGYIEANGTTYYLKPASFGTSINVAGTVKASYFDGNIKVSANNTTNETVYLTFVDGTTGSQGLETDTSLTYNPSTNTLTATTFSGTATTANEVKIANNSNNSNFYVNFAAGSSASESLYVDGDLTYNPSNNRLGIRATSPASNLHVKQSDASGWENGIRLSESDGGDTWVMSSASNLYFGYGTSENTNTITIKGYVSTGGFWVDGSSDIRFKNKLSTIENPIEKVKSLEGFRFNYNELGKQKFGFNSEGIHLGISAQDALLVTPEVVSELEDLEGKTGYYHVDYPKLVPLLIEAIKEQQTQIESLQEQINALSST